MYAKVTGLVELMPENQKILGHIWLMTMAANGFNVDGVQIEFTGEPNGSSE